MPLSGSLALGSGGGAAKGRGAACSPHPQGQGHPQGKAALACIPKSRRPLPDELSWEGGELKGVRGCSSELETLGQLPWSSSQGPCGARGGEACSLLSTRRLAPPPAGPPPAEACLDLFLQVLLCVGGEGGSARRKGRRDGSSQNWDAGKSDPQRLHPVWSPSSVLAA